MPLPPTRLFFIFVAKFTSSALQQTGCTGRNEETNVGSAGLERFFSTLYRHAAPRTAAAARAPAIPICSDFIIISSCNGITRDGGRKREREGRQLNNRRRRQGAVCGQWQPVCPSMPAPSSASSPSHHSSSSSPNPKPPSPSLSLSLVSVSRDLSQAVRQARLVHRRRRPRPPPVASAAAAPAVAHHGTGGGSGGTVVVAVVTGMLQS